MIVDFFLTTAEALVVWVLGLFPTDFEVPEWITGFTGLIAEILAGAHGMGIWIPWAFVFIVLGGTYLLWSAGLLLKFARFILGLIPTMGGS